MTECKSIVYRKNTHIALSLGRFDAVVFDLDGVITQTAKVHAAAWKVMFDDYLAKHAAEDKQFEPFNIETDYRRYVDGKPRYDGVRSFLQSRGIDLPYGTSDDFSDKETICGLGNRKNELFQKKLHTDGVEVYDSTITLIHKLRQAGIRIAVVSSSRNCQEILAAANIVDLFDARVDGVELQKLKLSGKPAPDMFIEASRRLASKPQRTVGVEDATAGVQALQAAGFGCVIGVNRGNQSQALYEHGADIVLSDLSELRLTTASEDTIAADQLPSALDYLDEIIPANSREIVLFLDYDGTLSSIVPNPDDAVLSHSMRSTLQHLAGLCVIAIVSGRDLGNLRERVGINDIWYAGSHGFDIAGPEGGQIKYQTGREYLPTLDAAEQALRWELTPIPGCLVERKHFSIAVHYRQVAQTEIEKLKKIVDEVHSAHPGLRLTSGKKIFELQPDIEWDKGKALRWLMQTLELDLTHFIPIYIGDDVTDEDAFRELKTDGIGIVVAQDKQETGASYRLEDPNAVEQFLKRLIDALEKSHA